MRTRFLLPTALLSLILTACMPKVDIHPKTLQIDAPSPSRGKIVIGEIKDLRKPGVGGGNFQILGVKRGTFGKPKRVGAARGYWIDDSLRDMLANSLKQAGYEPVPANTGSGLPTLETDVLAFWCDGYRGYGLTGNIGVRLVASTGTPNFEETVSYIEKFGIAKSHEPMKGAYANLVSEMEKKLAGLFASEKFRASVR